MPYDPYGIGQERLGAVTLGAGGGISSVFGRPAYQLLTNTGSKVFRTLPDVGMQVGGCPAGISASCNTAIESAAVVAYGVNYGGGFYGVIGTSVPVLASSLAGRRSTSNSTTGRATWNYLLYLAGAVQTAGGGPSAPAPLQFYHRNMPGFDGLYSGCSTSRTRTGHVHLRRTAALDVRKLFGFFVAPPAGPCRKHQRTLEAAKSLSSELWRMFVRQAMRFLEVRISRIVDLLGAG